MTEKTDDIAQQIKAGKSSTLDWLNAEADQKAIATTLVAMANSQGGKLIIGAEETEICGVKDSQAMTDRTLQAALSLTPPLILPVPRVVKSAEKDLIIVDVPSGMPHVYALDGLYLQREGTKNSALNPKELRRLMISRGEISFEAEITNEASEEDIDWPKAEAYVKDLKGIGESDVKRVLVRRGCLIQRDDKYYPTNAGILLFGKAPQQFMRGAEITAVRFGGETMSDTFTRQDINGTLPDQIRRAETFLVDHLRKAVKLDDKMARQEDYEYPMEAARELVVNAVAHRDYSIAGDTIRLFLFSDHMEVNSPGVLPGPMTVDNLKDERFSRNPAVVQVLSDMGFIERLGYGVDRVIELMERLKLQAPEFQERTGGFRVILHAAVEKSMADMETPGEKPAAEIVFNGFYNGQEINPRQEAALKHLHQEGNSRVTNSDLNTLFPDVHPETIRRDLVDLVNRDILEKMGQKRGSYYILKRETPEATTTTTRPEPEDA